MISPGQVRSLAAALAAAALASGLVVASEGQRNTTYLDQGGVPTICDGHTGADVKLGQRRTDQQCLTLLAHDLVGTATEISPCIKVVVPPESYAAFVSFSFNVGAPAFCRSAMARKLNAGDLAGACAELRRWVHIGPRVVPGLVKRRAAERAFCERGLK